MLLLTGVRRDGGGVDEHVWAVEGEVVDLDHSGQGVQV
jgi:hypothetical protein